MGLRNIVARRLRSTPDKGLAKSKGLLHNKPLRKAVIDAETRYWVNRKIAILLETRPDEFHRDQHAPR
jgi:hypothetical protein